MISVVGPISMSTPSITSGLPALPSAAIRPLVIATSHLTTPQWSSTTTFVMTTSGPLPIPWSIDSRIVLPPPNTASSPPTQRSSSTSSHRSVSARRTLSPTVGP